jgi:hypothetical protein
VVSGLSFLSISRTGILNLESSMAAIIPVGPAPAIKTGFKSSLMFCPVALRSLPRQSLRSGFPLVSWQDSVYTIPYVSDPALIPQDLIFLVLGGFATRNTTFGQCGVATAGLRKAAGPGQRIRRAISRPAALAAEIRREHFRKSAFMPGFERIVRDVRPEKEPSFLDRARGRWATRAKREATGARTGLFLPRCQNRLHAIGDLLPGESAIHASRQ